MILDPKQKAKELISKIIYGDLFIKKEIALLIVDEILNDPYNTQRDLSEELHKEFWNSVKKEINNL